MSEEPEKLAEGTLISHLLELRSRLIHALAAVGLFFIPCAYYSNQIFTFIAQPLLDKHAIKEVGGSGGRAGGRPLRSAGALHARQVRRHDHGV